MEFNMKRFAKKSLSVLLAVMLATTMFVCAFAVTENSEEIIWFDMEIDYKTNKVNVIAFDVEGYSILNEDAFACSIFDSEDNEVLDQSMVDIEYYAPGDFEFAKDIVPEEDYEFIYVILFVNEDFIVNPDETYTLEIYEHAFSAADETQSEMLSYSFLPSDFIYIPTIWDKILFVLNSNPVLQVLFARVIMIIEFFYYSPWFPIPLFG